MNPTNNINISGGQNQNHFGTGDQNQTNLLGGGTREATIETFFASLKQEAESLPPKPAIELTETAIKPLEQYAMSPPEGLKADEPSLYEHYYEKLKPHAGLIMRCTAAFTEASLRALALQNPIVAGIIAVAGTIRVEPPKY